MKAGYHYEIYMIYTVQFESDHINNNFFNFNNIFKRFQLK